MNKFPQQSELKIPTFHFTTQSEKYNHLKLKHLVLTNDNNIYVAQLRIKIKIPCVKQASLQKTPLHNHNSPNVCLLRLASTFRNKS